MRAVALPIIFLTPAKNRLYKLAADRHVHASSHPKGGARTGRRRIFHMEIEKEPLEAAGPASQAPAKLVRLEEDALAKKKKKKKKDGEEDEDEEEEEDEDEEEEEEEDVEEEDLDEDDLDEEDLEDEDLDDEDDDEEDDDEDDDEDEEDKKEDDDKEETVGNEKGEAASRPKRKGVKSEAPVPKKTAVAEPQQGEAVAVAAVA